MESLRRRWRELPLRRFFMLTVLGTVFLAMLLSGLVIWGCRAFRNYLLPDPNAVYLTVDRTMDDGVTTEETYLLEYGDSPAPLPELVITEDDNIVERQSTRIKYSIQKIEKSVESLTPKRKLAYQACGIIMVAAPAFFFFAGIIFCSLYFYRQNNRTMWEMLEERRLLWASVAHDLRNPIAIIQGYTQYLKAGLEKGQMEREKLFGSLRNLTLATKRLEQYTDSLRLLNRSQEQPLEKRSLSAAELAEKMTLDFGLLAKREGISLRVESSLGGEQIQADETLIYRVLENLISNSLRYAKREIGLSFRLSGRVLYAAVTDDGEGFPQDILDQQGKAPGKSKGEGHMGIGLAISRILCQKHGGGLALSNGSKGACVQVWLDVS